MSKQIKAVNRFNAGFNCAQSVLSPFAEEMDIDKNTILIMTQGFGAGMGRLQETCGAVTGAYMVLGLKYGGSIPDDNRNEKTIGKIQEFTHRFKEKHSVTTCRELLNCDLKTDEGQQYFSDNSLHDTVCSKCVSNAVEILEELIAKD